MKQCAFVMRAFLLLLTPLYAATSADSDSPPPAPAGYDWRAIPELSDEFDTATLDGQKWQPGHPYWSGREPSAFDPANVSVKDGLLQLRSSAKVDTLDGIKNMDQDVWVASACVTSLTPLASHGCYYAAHFKASRLSMTSSFWLQGKYSEIDIVEQVGDSIKTPGHNRLMMSNTHYYPDGWTSDKWTHHEHEMTSGAADDFHTYGVWWKDARTVWLYLDGEKVEEVTTKGEFNEPLYLFFDTEVFKWEGNPALESLKDDSRNTMQVDWVRGWRLVKNDN
jgi:beta-glucanase (GH16 family)